MRLSPILQGPITFAFTSGKSGTDLIEWYDLHVGDPGNEARSIAVVHDNLNFPDARSWLGLGLVRPKERRPSAFAATPDEGEQLLGQFGGVSECAHLSDTFG